MTEETALAIFETETDIVEFSETAVEPHRELPDLLDYSRKLAALHEIAKAAKVDIPARNRIVACDALARRRAGGILADPAFKRMPPSGVRPCDTMSLADLGLDGDAGRKTASRLMSLATGPQVEWDQYVHVTEILTHTGFLNLAKKLTVPPEIVGEYNVIVLDPPWPGRKIIREVRPNQERQYDYPDMTIEGIKRMDLPVADDCHVFLWITHKLLLNGFDIFGHWGVRYVCTFVWHKPGGYQPVGLPQYNCEFVLYGRIGKPIFRDTKDFNVCFTAPRGRHSEKPDFFFEMIARTTGGRRLSMYERKEREGFEVWGNEAGSTE